MKIEMFIPTWENAGRTLLQLTAAVVLAAVGWQVYRTAGNIREYVEFQTAELKSDKNRKAIEAGIAAAASYQATARLLNTQTIPELTSAIRESRQTFTALNAEIVRLGAVTSNLSRFVADTNARVNGESGTLAQLNSNLRSIERASDMAMVQVEKIGTETTAAVASLRERIEDPKLDRIAANLEQTSANLGAISGNLVETSARTNAVMTETEATMRNVTATTAHLAEAAGATKDAIKSGSKISRITSALRIGILGATLYSLIF